MSEHAPTTLHRVVKFPSIGGSGDPVDDIIISEDPLTIELEYGAGGDRKRFTFTSTMRTPGNDLELALGLVKSEGIIESYQDIQSIRELCPDCDDADQPSRVLVSLNTDVDFNPGNHRRSLLMSSSCGICGKIDMAQVKKDHGNIGGDDFEISGDKLFVLSESVRKKQVFFKHTGSVHAAGLFNHLGDIHIVREDVGRHNAMDKLVGAMMMMDNLHPTEMGVFFSGRTSYELIQKSIVAGIGFVVSVGAPSSLAIQLSEAAGITLVGFLKSSGFNIYSNKYRILRNSLTQNGQHQSGEPNQISKS